MTNTFNARLRFRSDTMTRTTMKNIIKELEETLSTDGFVELCRDFKEGDDSFDVSLAMRWSLKSNVETLGSIAEAFGVRIEGRGEAESLSFYEVCTVDASGELAQCSRLEFFGGPTVKADEATVNAPTGDKKATDDDEVDKLGGMTLREIEQIDTYDENFQLAFHRLFTKFVEEYNDMSQMEIIKDAQDLLNKINDL